jgi:hypothetical protein
MIANTVASRGLVSPRIRTPGAINRITASDRNGLYSEVQNGPRAGEASGIAMTLRSPPSAITRERSVNLGRSEVET